MRICGTFWIPVLFSVAGVGCIVFNFFCSMFITKNSSFVKYLPSISEFSGKFPERAIFAFFMNFCAFCFTVVVYERVRFIKKYFHVALVIFFVGVAAIAIFCLSLLSIISMYDQIWVHNILALLFFLFILFFHILWFLQDIWLKLKHQYKYLSILFLSARSFLLLTLTVVCIGTVVAVIILWDSKYGSSIDNALAVTVFSIFEYLYVLMNFVHVSLTCVDLFHMREGKKKEEEELTRKTDDYDEIVEDVEILL